MGLLALLYLALYLLATRSQAQPTCYSAETRLPVTGDEPCHKIDENQSTTCCGASQSCMENNLCYNAAGDNGIPQGYWRGSCTDATWESPQCVKCLAESDGFMYQCPTNSSNWCCYSTMLNNTCDCNTGAHVLQLGPPGGVVKAPQIQATAPLSWVPTSTSTSIASRKKSWDTGKTIGVVIGCLFVTFIAVLSVWFFLRRLQQKNTPKARDSAASSEDSGLPLEDGAPNAFGIASFAMPANAIVDIIFVHGLTGKREKTWTHSNGVCWPKTLLPVDLPMANIMSFGYDADVAHVLSVASSNRLRDHGKSLARDLADIRSRMRNSTRPIIFIAHSLGGLVVEQALLISRNSNDQDLNLILKYTFAIAFMGTPHGGSGLADWGSVLTRMFSFIAPTNRDIVKALERDSETLAAVEEDFQQMLMGKHIEVFCFYESNETRGFGRIVPPESAILRQYENVQITADHSGMTKFYGKLDAGYLSVLGRLQTWVARLNASGTPDA